VEADEIAKQKYAKIRGKPRLYCRRKDISPDTRQAVTAIFRGAPPATPVNFQTKKTPVFHIKPKSMAKTFQKARRPWPWD
jgi:hypothetical protein